MIVNWSNIIKTQDSDCTKMFHGNTEQKRNDGLMTYNEFCDAHPEFQVMMSINFNPMDEYNKYLIKNDAKPIEKNDVFSINKNRDFDPRWLYC